MCAGAGFACKTRPPAADCSLGAAIRERLARNRGAWRGRTLPSAARAAFGRSNRSPFVRNNARIRGLRPLIRAFFRPNVSLGALSLTIRRLIRGLRPLNRRRIARSKLIRATLPRFARSSGPLSRALRAQMAPTIVRTGRSCEIIAPGTLQNEIIRAFGAFGPSRPVFYVFTRAGAPALRIKYGLRPHLRLSRAFDRRAAAALKRPPPPSKRSRRRRLGSELPSRPRPPIAGPQNQARPRGLRPLAQALVFWPPKAAGGSRGAPPPWPPAAVLTQRVNTASGGVWSLRDHILGACGPQTPAGGVGLRPILFYVAR